MASVAFLMYPVSDVPKSVEFYRDVVGLTQHGMKQPWWVEFDVNGTAFGIGNVPDNGVPGTAQSLVLEVENIDRFVERVREAGVAVSDPSITPYGCRIASFKDPDGNTVWLHQS